jgi:uncharacterized protein
VLAEKEQLTPDNYPMSLNALVNGCNQLSSRDPVMTLAEEEVQDALDRLMAKKLAAEVSQAGARVAKYEHRMRLRWTLEQDRLAALALLMLRGPQTAAELRLNTERLHRFADISSVEAFLDELAARRPEPLVVRLPRAPGAREARWAHLLGGPVEAASASPAAAPEDVVSSGEIAALKANQMRLHAEVAMLRAQLHRLAAELGVDLQ